MITFQNASYSIDNKPILKDITFDLEKGESMVILGPNGSGKTSLTRVIVDRLPVQSGSYSIDPEARIGYVSFELERKIKKRERREEEVRFFVGDEDSYTSVRTMIDPYQKYSLEDVEDALSLSEIEYLMDHDIRNLSTGELRKAIFARALLKSPNLLVLDEPFNGLDSYSKRDIKQLIDSLIYKGHSVVLITHRFEEIPSYIENVLLLKQGAILTQGNKDQVITSENISTLYDTKLQVEQKGTHLSVNSLYKSLKTDPNNKPTQQESLELVQFQNVTLNYPNKPLLNSLSWSMDTTNNWAILGPNGTGKTTTLDLILRNNPKSYALNIKTFGTRIGKGNSKWDDLRKIGLVTPELNTNYSKDITAREVIISGIYDTIGLYTKPKLEDLSKVEQCSKLLPTQFDLDRNFEKLSYGQRQLVLILRAIIKNPKLLILDEPTHGLDLKYRFQLLELIENIMQSQTSNVILTTHHKDEIPPSITHILEFDGEGGHNIKATY